MCEHTNRLVFADRLLYATEIIINFVRYIYSAIIIVVDVITQLIIYI